MRHREHLEMIDELYEIEEDLKVWESDFVESLRYQIDRGRPLTREQQDKLCEIHSLRVLGYN